MNIIITTRITTLIIGLGHDNDDNDDNNDDGDNNDKKKIKINKDYVNIV